MLVEPIEEKGGDKKENKWGGRDGENNRWAAGSSRNNAVVAEEQDEHPEDKVDRTEQPGKVV